MATINLNRITTTIKSVKNIKKFNLKSSSFIQPFHIPENQIDIESENIIFNEKYESFKPLMTYVENEIIEVPEIFSEFLDLNNYYIYGTVNIYETITILLNREFLGEGKIDKKDVVETLKNKLLDELNINYKKFDYKKTYMTKNNLIQNLNESPSTMNNDILRYFCDVLKINCLYIDIETKKYKLFKCFNQEVVVDNIVVIGYNKNILPLVNIRYDKFTYKDLLKIKDYFKEVVTLKTISAYSMVELVELAEDNKINVKQTEINKKKTKQMLYDELKKIFE